MIQNAPHKKNTVKKSTSAKRKPRLTKKEQNVLGEYKKFKHQILIFAGVGLVLALLIIFGAEYANKHSPTNISYVNNCTEPIKPTTKLRDLNAIHILHAKRNGIGKPIQNQEDFDMQIDSLRKNKKLVKIRNNGYYIVKKLSYSEPYLTPEAATLLNEIGARFQINLRKNDLPRYKFEISSMLRTVGSQKRLLNVNRNATPNESSHYYGTTFDIAYDTYYRHYRHISDPKVEQVLKETLQEMREECRLLVVNEKNNKCYHITVTKLKNDAQ